MAPSPDPSSAMESKSRPRTRRIKSTVRGLSALSHRAGVCLVILPIHQSGDADQMEHVPFAMPVDFVSFLFFIFSRGVCL